MNHREKLHAARTCVGDDTRAMLRMFSLDTGKFVDVVIELARNAFAAGYAAAEPDVCARCGAEMEGRDG